MCAKKRRAQEERTHSQQKTKAPTRVFVHDERTSPEPRSPVVRTSDRPTRPEAPASPPTKRAGVVVPQAVRAAAERALALRASGEQGGTATGWRRAEQLAHSSTVDATTLRNTKKKIYSVRTTTHQLTYPRHVPPTCRCVLHLVSSYSMRRRSILCHIT
jgi:hypothetical protein